MTILAKGHTDIGRKRSMYYAAYFNFIPTLPYVGRHSVRIEVLGLRASSSQTSHAMKFGHMVPPSLVCQWEGSGTLAHSF